jgi:dipeptidyl aminopeptidase/acylaminoacyl peptidase
MLAVRETRAKQGDDLDKFSSKVQAVVSLAGPTDLRDTPELSTPVLVRAISNLWDDDTARAEAVIADASPIRFVTKDAAPTLFIAGATDPWVPNAHAHRMAEALKNRGVETEVIVLEGLGHGIFPGTTPQVRDATVEWFDKYLATRPN